MDFLSLAQPIIHYGLHFLFPGLLAYTFFKDSWKNAWGLMVVTMLVDLDHLLVNPIFDAGRCSIGFHLLHSYIAIAFYFGLLFFPNKYIRIISAGLLFHVLTDLLDCAFMSLFI